jgi:hypothetical protein
MSAPDGRSGCLVPTNRSFDFFVDTSCVKLAFSRIRYPEEHHTSFLWPDADPDLDFEYPLATRKWALQERLLSRRIVHFTAHDLVWECRTCMMLCTCGKLDKDFPINTLKKSFHTGTHETDDVSSLSMTYMRVVTSYSNADLSHDTDVLPALTGIATKFQTADLGRYYAGIWERTLPEALCWWTDSASSTRMTSSQSYIAPAWSWASVQGSVCFDVLDCYDTAGYEMERAARIIDFKCSRRDESEFGPVEIGTLTLRTIFCNIPQMSISERDISGYENSELSVDTPEDLRKIQDHFETTVYLLALIVRKPLDEDQALLLKHTNKSKYLRYGWFRCSDHELRRFKEGKEIDIV